MKKEKPKPKKILILGGGLSGLSAALKLKEFNKNLDITIFEKKQYFGGLAASFKQGEFLIPIFYHHIISSNKITMKYLNKYNLLKNCKWKRIKLAITHKNKIININSLKGLLSYKGLSLFGKFRFGIFGLYVVFLIDPKKINSNLDAHTWLIKNAGKEVTESIFYHLYARNKFNVPLTELSAKQLANRLKEREIYDKFTYPRKGLQKMIQGIINDLKSYNVNLHTNINIRAIDFKKKQFEYKIKTNSKKILENFDIIINTIPIPSFLEVVQNLLKDYKQELLKLKYCPVVNIVFGTSKSLDNKHYWINLFGEKPHIIIQHSILNDNYPWKVNWVLRYGGSEEDLNKTDLEIKKDYLGVVKKYFPHADIVWAKVFKEKHAEPIYDKNYGDYAPKNKTPIQGLYMAGIQTTYPKIRNMNVALESGEKIAKIISKDLTKNKKL